LDYVGIPVSQQYDNANWSRNFIQWLEQLPLDPPASRLTLNYQIREVQLLRSELLSICNDVRKLMRSKKYKDLYYRLRTITGIGPLTAAALITEIGDMKRFASFYHLNSFIGLMPMEHSSGEKIMKGSITVRKHRQLRSDLIECAWAAKRNDPALALYYNQQLTKGKNGKAAIVKVARKLLSRIRYVWLSNQPYQIAVLQ
jgi:transposase